MYVKDDPKHHHRRSVRLKGYDYSQSGAYFITICTYGRQCVLGEFRKGKLVLNKKAPIVLSCWERIHNHYNYIVLDEYIIMPNHIHGIIFINNNCRGEVTSPLQRNRKISLGQIIAYFKYQSTKEINKMRGTPGQRFWQRNYYEHIIRNENELNKIREYIIYNPLKWELDKENPINRKHRK